MALTRPRFGQLNTSIVAEADPITVLNQGASSANVDVGFLFNRANGLVSNVALYWSESAQSIVTAYTANTGATNSNISVSSYANLTIGNLLMVNGSILNVTGNITVNTLGTHYGNVFATTVGTSTLSLTQAGSGNQYALTMKGAGSGDQWAFTVGSTAGQNNITSLNTAGSAYAPFTVNGSTFTIGTTGAGATTSLFVANSGNVVIPATTTSTSTTTGALTVSGGVGVGGNITASGNIYAVGTNSKHGYTWANSVSSAYTVFNSATNSIDTVFG
jgi:hypothetical protein